MRAHAPAQQTTCYVNPADPREAVLVNTLPEEASYLWLFLLFPIGGVCLIGALLGSVVFSLTKRGRPTSVADPICPTTLKPRLSPSQEAALYGVICVVFDAMLGGLWFCEISLLRGGQAGWTTAVFLIIVLGPFSALGILCTFVSGRSVLAIFNPRPTLELTPGRIPLGGSAQLSWQFTGRTASLRSLQIVLSGTEQANRQGRHAYFYQHVFHQTVLFHTFAPDCMRAGESRFVFPMETMHSFHSPNNSIIWSIDVRDKLRRCLRSGSSFRSQ